MKNGQRRHRLEFSREGLTFAAETTNFAVDQESRTITGLAVPWNQVARNRGENWRFERGSIKYSAVNRVKLLRDHDNTQAIGKAVSIQDTDAGLLCTFKISPGPAGDHVLALAADEVLDGLSIGVEWRDEDYGPDPLNPGAYLVRSAALREVSLTAVPAFDDSRLTSVRASNDGGFMNKCPTCGATLTTGVAHTCTPAPANNPTPAPTNDPVLVGADAPAAVTFTADQFAAFMAAHSQAPAPTAAPDDSAPVAVRPTVDPTAANGNAPAGNAATFVAEPLPYRFTHVPRKGAQAGKHVFHSSEHDFSSDLFAMIDGRDNDGTAAKRVQGMIRAAFDVDTTDVAGTIPKVQRPEMWQPQMDYATPLWDIVNSGSTDGTPFELPKFDSSSGLVSPAVEGVEPAPGAFAVTTQTITPGAVWGKVEITRQATRRRGNPQISSIIWDQMLREYYEDREASVATFLNTLVAATDITLTVPTGAADNTEDQAMVRDLEAALTGLQFVRGGNRFSAFVVHQDLYKVLARVTDTAGRKLFPMIGAQNANGTTAPLYKMIDIGGTMAVPSWALGATSTDPRNSWLFDPQKVRGWASAPERLEWNFGATVQGTNIPQLAHVTLGIYGDVALANLDINGVRQVIADTTGS